LILTGKNSHFSNINLIGKEIAEPVDSLDYRGLRHFEMFWFYKIININKITGKPPATSDLVVDAPSARQCGVELSKAPPRPFGRRASGATTKRSSRIFFSS